MSLLDWVAEVFKPNFYCTYAMALIGLSTLLPGLDQL